MIIGISVLGELSRRWGWASPAGGGYKGGRRGGEVGTLAWPAFVTSGGGGRGGGGCF